MEMLLEISKVSPGASIALEFFFLGVEALIIWAGVYFYCNRGKFFSHNESEGDTYASANLRMAMVVLI